MSAPAATSPREEQAEPRQKPRRLTELLSDPDTAKAQRVMGAMLQMRKIEIAELERAAEGQPVR